MALDVTRIKKDFPILERQVHGTRLVYLDSASSSQKPTAVIEAMDHYYETTHANVHRGVYTIAEEATRLYEEARGKVATFVGAGSAAQIVFAKNVTEAINLVAHSWGRRNLSAGDVVVLTEMEHHANLVPWLQLKEERGIELRYLRIDGNGELVLDDLDAKLSGAKLLAFTAISNVLGTITPVRRLADAAHAAGALALVDGAQLRPAVARRRGRAGRRLPRLHRPQDARSDGHRLPVGPTRAARGHATVPRRRRDDPRRPPRRFHAQRGSLEVRGGHAADRRGGRAGCGRRLSGGGRHGRGARPRART